jgi:hypothetical protein
MADLTQVIEEFRIGYYQCAGVSNFNELDSKGKVEFAKAWKHAKAEFVGAA